VNDNPVTCSAYFSSYGDSLDFYFSDMSSTSAGNVISWAWDFGDNTTSMVQNPTHLFTQAGSYTVCLTMTTDNSCSATFCNIVYVNQNSNVIVDTIANLTQTLSAMLFGSCVSVSNLTYTGAPEAVGYFLDNGSTLDSAFNYGLVLSSGNVHNIVGPNTSTGSSADNQLAGDSDLDALIPSYTTYDAAIIEFDFSSVSDTIIASKIIFASEEYPEYVGTTFNDVFGFYISGPGITGLQNLAVIPTTTDPISVNSVNPNLNTGYYIDNTNGISYQFDGRTTVIELHQAITAGQTYHFKIAIADAGDHVLDSWVMIKAGSFNGNTQLPVASFASTNSGNQGLTVNMSNLSTDANLYAWNFGDNSPIDITSNPSHTYTTAGTYTVTLVASNVCYTDTTTAVITVGANGVAELSATNGIKIVPTSSEGVYSAQVQSTVTEKVQIKVYSVNGQLVINEARNGVAGLNNYTLDLSGFAPGLYSVQLIGSKELFNGKLMR
jgi:PKD repeat protein